MAGHSLPALTKYLFSALFCYSVNILHKALNSLLEIGL